MLQKFSKGFYFFPFPLLNWSKQQCWNQGDRTCYMCGSPDHLIRDCPAASSPHSLLQRGIVWILSDISPKYMYWQSMYVILTWFVIQEILCFQEVFRVMYHHIGMVLPFPMSGPLGTYMEMLGWCPSMQPWSRLPPLPYLLICHLYMVVFLPSGKFNLYSVECCLQCTGSDQHAHIQSYVSFIRS